MPGGRVFGLNGPDFPRSTTDNTSVTLFSTAFVPPISQIRALLWGVPQENTKSLY